MTLNSPCAAAGVCDVLQCVGVCTRVFARALYGCRGTFAPATFPSLAGVAHVACVAQWVADGSRSSRNNVSLAPQLLSADEALNTSCFSARREIECYMTEGGFL